MTPGRLISPDPLKATPPIFLDAAKTVAEPALPDTVPVTLPSKLPSKPPVDVVTPVTSKSFCIFTFFVVVIPVTPSKLLQVPPAPADPPPPEILTSIVVPLTKNVFPVPTKLRVSALPITTPAD